jgi:starch synthase
MKVLYILPYDWGGMPHYVAEIANSVSKDAEVTVVGSKAIHVDYFVDKVKIVKIFDSLNLSMSYTKGLFSLNTIKGLFSFNRVKIINEIKPDVIHIAVPLIPPLSFFIWAYGLDTKYPIVYTKHRVISDSNLSEKIFEEYILNFFEKLVSIGKVIVHTQNDKKDLLASRKLGAIDETKVAVIPHGTYSFFKNSGGRVSTEDKCILFFGSIKDYKGLEYLIKAVPLIAKRIPDIKVIIAGEGDLASYQSLMEVCDRSVFEVHNEFVPDNLVASLFQRSTIAVLPYTEMSGMSGVLNVAYAFGKPVVVSDVGGLDEVVEHGKTGLLVPPRDPRALADAIVQLLADPDLRAMMEKNVETKAEELSWDGVAKKTMEIYKEICVRNGKKISPDSSETKVPNFEGTKVNTGDEGLFDLISNEKTSHHVDKRK